MAAADTATSHLGAPTGVVVTPTVGGIRVSWNLDPQTGVTYVVHSSPSGLNCSVQDQSSCAMEDRTSVPYSFFVTAKGGGSRASSSRPTAPIDPHLVLVVVGQSNATGWQSFVTDPNTGIDYFAAPYTNGADSHDLITWEPWWVYAPSSSSPVPLDSPQVCSIGPANTVFGPEIGLARQLWTDTGRSVTIVKATAAGSDLYSNWDPTIPNDLFWGMVSEVTGVMANDAAQGQFDVLGGVYSEMGESDAAFASSASSYRKNLKNFIEALREDLPIAKRAPVVLAKEDISAYLYWLEGQGELTAGQVSLLLTQNNEVRTGDDWAASNMHGVVEIDTSTLARFDPPEVHLTNVSELTLGQEMARASEPLLP